MDLRLQNSLTIKFYPVYINFRAVSIRKFEWFCENINSFIVFELISTFIKMSSFKKLQLDIKRKALAFLLH